MTHNLSDTLSGVPKMYPVGIRQNEPPVGCSLSPSQCNPTKLCFETQVYLHQGWLSCSNLDKCQFIRVLINCINGEALCEVNFVTLLDYCSNGVLIGNFTTPKPLCSLDLCIQGTLYDHLCLKQSVRLEPSSYRVQIWPPPHTPVPCVDEGDCFPLPIFAIVTVSCTNNCCRRWDIQLVTGCLPTIESGCNTGCGSGGCCGEAGCSSGGCT